MPTLSPQTFNLHTAQERIESRLKQWHTANVAQRIWDHDGTVWVSDPEEAANTAELTNRLGWLTIVEEMQAEADDLMAFAAAVKDDVDTVVLLGMGGSSLCPEVMMQIFGNADGYPPLIVLDNTNPHAVQQVSEQIDPAKTLFVVSSKSGGTVETLSFYKYFFEAVSAVSDTPGQHFVAVTDPGSKLEKEAEEKGFRRVFSAPPTVGGRYSAMTFFGLVPSALIGLDVADLLARAKMMADACGPDRHQFDNPGLALGAVMGELATQGQDKITFFTSPTLAPFGLWVEQLIAESTGKQGTGILPVADEAIATADHYGDDRVFVYLRLAGDDNDALDEGMTALRAAKYHTVTIDLAETADLTQEFFRWEMATAAASAILDINPFDQPNVESAKVQARKLMTAYEESGSLPSDEPVLSDEERNIQLYGGTGSGDSLAEAVTAFLDQVGSGDYIALMAYVLATPETDAALDAIRLALRDRFKVATTVGYGPRFLHSTGQLHKGDGNNGLFIQITHSPSLEVDVPGEAYDFNTLVAAQAQGDYNALAEADRRLLRFHLNGDVAEGLQALEALF